jgi:hypothetical protein
MKLNELLNEGSKDNDVIADKLHTAQESGKIKWETEYKWPDFIRRTGVKKNVIVKFAKTHDWYKDEFPIELTKDGVYLGDPREL